MHDNWHWYFGKCTRDNNFNNEIQLEWSMQPFSSKQLNTISSDLLPLSHWGWNYLKLTQLELPGPSDIFFLVAMHFDSLRNNFNNIHNCSYIIKHYMCEILKISKFKNMWLWNCLFHNIFLVTPLCTLQLASDITGCWSATLFSLLQSQVKKLCMSVISLISGLVEGRFTIIRI